MACFVCLWTRCKSPQAVIKHLATYSTIKVYAHLVFMNQLNNVGVKYIVLLVELLYMNVHFSAAVRINEYDTYL